MRYNNVYPEEVADTLIGAYSVTLNDSNDIVTLSFFTDFVYSKKIA